jgi:hypothetical protein
MGIGLAEVMAAKMIRNLGVNQDEGVRIPLVHEERRPAVRGQLEPIDLAIVADRRRRPHPADSGFDSVCRRIAGGKRLA